MTEPVETVDPAAANPPSSPVQGAGSGAIPAGYVEKARLDGALQKVQELTLANRTLTEQLAVALSQVGQTQGTVAQKDAEQAALTSGHASALQALQTKLDDATKVIAANATEKMKIDALKAINRPELIAILDSLPVGADIEATKIAYQKIASFGDSLSHKREAELLAGVTTTTGQGGPITPPEPTTEKDWIAYVNAQPFGSPARQQAWDKYWAFTQKPQK